MDEWDKGCLASVGLREIYAKFGRIKLKLKCFDLKDSERPLEGKHWFEKTENALKVIKFS